jgi:DinB superfamily
VTAAGPTVTAAVRGTHDAILATVRAVGPAELSASRGPSAPPISFHVWHAARWADRMAAHLESVLGPESVTSPGESWVTDGWAERFGFGGHDLGFGDTGMGLADDTWDAFPPPDRQVLMGYAEAAFHRANQVIKPAGNQTDRECLDLYGRPGSVADVLVGHLSHVSRHLGMIEALIGLTGRPGTASV